MIDEKNKNQENIEKSLKEKRSVRILFISSILLLLAIAATVSAIWFMNNKDVKTYNQIAQSINQEGAIKGASTADPDYVSKLAESLKASGFVLYGSDSNIKTKKQKDVFSQAISGIDYVECDPQIKSANSAECAAREIKIYPTWVSGDKKFEGYKSLSEIEKMIAEISNQ
jgi:hypothetical protein